MVAKALAAGALGTRVCDSTTAQSHARFHGSVHSKLHRAERHARHAVRSAPYGAPHHHVTGPRAHLTSQGRRSTSCKAANGDMGGLEDHVVIGGAGIAGMAVALGLSRAGVPVAVLEESEESRESGAVIALWQNAVRALKALGVEDDLEITPSLERIELCAAKGDVLRGFSLDECDGGPHCLRGVSRGTLLRTLEAALPAGTVRYGAGVTGAQPTADGAVEVSLSGGSKLRCAAFVGADGARSATASSLGVRSPSLSGYSAYRGVAKFGAGKLPVPLDTCRQVWGSGVRAGLYPLSDADAYWFVCFNTEKSAVEGRAAPTAADRKADAAALVAGWGHGVAECIAATPEDEILRNRIGDRLVLPGATVGTGNVTLAGDALHPMTPNLGQGGCCALEDAVVLARMLGNAWKTPSEVEGALREYERERTARVAKITAKANAMGQALQIDFAPVTFVRNTFVSTLFSPAHFLSHATYDCGTIPQAARAPATDVKA